MIRENIGYINGDKKLKSKKIPSFRGSIVVSVLSLILASCESWWGGGSENSSNNVSNNAPKISTPEITLTWEEWSNDQSINLNDYVSDPENHSISFTPVWNLPDNMTFDEKTWIVTCIYPSLDKTTSYEIYFKVADSEWKEANEQIKITCTVTDLDDDSPISWSISGENQFWVSEDSQILSITWIDNDWTWNYSWVIYDNNWNAVYSWNHSWSIQSSVSSDFDLKQFNLTKGNYKFEAVLTWTIWWENPENSKTLEHSFEILENDVPTITLTNVSSDNNSISFTATASLDSDNPSMQSCSYAILEKWVSPTDLDYIPFSSATCDSITKTWLSSGVTYVLYISVDSVNWESGEMEKTTLEREITTNTNNAPEVSNSEITLTWDEWSENQSINLNDYVSDPENHSISFNLVWSLPSNMTFDSVTWELVCSFPNLDQTTSFEAYFEVVDSLGKKANEQIKITCTVTDLDDDSPISWSISGENQFWVSEDSQILSITWIDNDWTWTYSWKIYDNSWNAVYSWNHSWSIQSSVSSDFDLKQFNLTKGNYKFEAVLTWTIWWENPENSKTLEHSFEILENDVPTITLTNVSSDINSISFTANASIDSDNDNSSLQTCEYAVVESWINPSDSDYTAFSSATCDSITKTWLNSGTNYVIYTRVKSKNGITWNTEYTIINQEISTQINNAPEISNSDITLTWDEWSNDQSINLNDYVSDPENHSISFTPVWNLPDNMTFDSVTWELVCSFPSLDQTTSFEAYFEVVDSLGKKANEQIKITCTVTDLDDDSPISWSISGENQFWVSEDSQILSITWIDNDWTWTYSWVVYDNNWNAIYNWNHSWNIQSSVSSDFDLKQFNLTKGNYKFEATLTWTIWWENPENSKTLEHSFEILENDVPTITLTNVSSDNNSITFTATASLDSDNPSLQSCSYAILEKWVSPTDLDYIPFSSATCASITKTWLSSGVTYVLYILVDSMNWENGEMEKTTLEREITTNTDPVISWITVDGHLEIGSELTNIWLDIADDDLSKVTWELKYSNVYHTDNNPLLWIFSQSTGTWNTLKDITFTPDIGWTSWRYITAEITDSASSNGVQIIQIYDNDD